jgi:predicted neuraminidase
MEAGFRKSDLREGMWAEYALPYSRMLIEAAGNSENRQKGWMPRIHPITLPTGRILLPLYSDGFNASIMAISDDEGEHWRSSKPIIVLGPIQPSVVRRKEGQLVAYLRDSGPRPGRVMQSISNDDGESWSAAVDTDIPNPGASIDTIALRDGRWIMALNDTEQGRHRLALAGSDDEGQSGKWRLYV